MSGKLSMNFNAIFLSGETPYPQFIHEEGVFGTMTPRRSSRRSRPDPIHVPSSYFSSPGSSYSPATPGEYESFANPVSIGRVEMMIAAATPVGPVPPSGEPPQESSSNVNQIYDHSTGRTVSSGQSALSITNEPLKTRIRDGANIRGETTRIEPLNKYEGVGMLRYERGSIITTDSVFDIMDPQRRFREHLPDIMDSTPLSSQPHRINLPHGKTERHEETIFTRPEREHFPLIPQRARTGRTRLINYTHFYQCRCFLAGHSRLSNNNNNDDSHHGKNQYQ